MAHVEVAVEDDEVVVRPRGLDVVWTFKRQVHAPLSALRSVAVGPPSRPRGQRAPGTYVPGLIRAGTWRSRAGREFWDVRRGRRVVVLDFADGAPYRRMVLEVPDPDATARRLGARAPSPG